MSALADQIAEVLRAHIPYQAIDGRRYCKNHDCRPVNAEEAKAWDWEVHVAEQVAAELNLAKVVDILEWHAGVNHPASQHLLRVLGVEPYTDDIYAWLDDEE